MQNDQLSLKEKLGNCNFFVAALLTILATIGFFMLYDAADQNLQPWCQPQALKFLMGIPIMMLVAVSPIRWWIRYAYVLYFLSLLLLVFVEVFGHVGMGAQRWLNFYVFRIQPSESMRISLILVLACYFHRRNIEDIQRFSALLVPLALIFLPVALVLRQPDLGTAIMLMASGVLVMFAAGVQLRYFIGAMIAGIAAIPALWLFLRDYQKNRILTFLDPERDPFGAGYHILQSKIAIGSGGFFGKGFGHGTQSHLNFLPEKQTDFIFTMFAEEFGFLGSISLLFIMALLIATGLFLALRCQSTFARLTAIGIIGTVFLYLFINMAMVMGLLPVVGVPLPLISYGGTALLTLMIGFGFLLNADIHRDINVKRYY